MSADNPARDFLSNLVAALQVTAILLVVAGIGIAFAYLVFAVIL